MEKKGYRGDFVKENTSQESNKCFDISSILQKKFTKYEYVGISNNDFLGKMATFVLDETSKYSNNEFTKEIPQREIKSYGKHLK